MTNSCKTKIGHKQYHAVLSWSCTNSTFFMSKLIGQGEVTICDSHLQLHSLKHEALSRSTCVRVPSWLSRQTSLGYCDSPAQRQLTQFTTIMAASPLTTHYLLDSSVVTLILDGELWERKQ